MQPNVDGCVTRTDLVEDEDQPNVDGCVTRTDLVKDEDHATKCR